MSCGTAVVAHGRVAAHAVFVETNPRPLRTTSKFVIMRVTGLCSSLESVISVVSRIMVIGSVLSLCQRDVVRHRVSSIKTRFSLCSSVIGRASVVETWLLSRREIVLLNALRRLMRGEGRHVWLEL